MSMLRKILADMYVDPELLAELDEEQKQILFCKMREEQLRRNHEWSMSEEGMGVEGVYISQKKANERRIEWLLDSRDEVWVWVMGEHGEDATIDDIIDREIETTAAHIADDELAAVREAKETALKLTLAKVHSSGHTESNTPDAPMQHSREFDDVDDDQHTDAYFGGGHDDQSTQAQELMRRLADLPDPTTSTTCDVDEGGLSPGGIWSTTFHTPTTTTSDPMSIPQSSTSTVTKLPLHLTVTDGERQSSTNSTYESPGVLSNNVRREIHNLENVIKHSNHEASFSELERQLTEQTEREIDAERQRRQAAIYETLKAARANMVDERVDAETEDARRHHERQEAQARNAERQMREMARRARHLYRQQKSMFEAAAMTTNTSDSSTASSGSAGNASTTHRDHATTTHLPTPRSHYGRPWANVQPIDDDVLTAQLQATLQIDGLFDRPMTSSSSRSPLPPTAIAKDTARSARPRTRQQVIDWYSGVELARGSGLDPKTGTVAAWFHGLITRERSEELLVGRRVGAFLLRVSERIWGYTLSYCQGDDHVKHFLVEAADDGYRFMGANQTMHNTLWDLISYHESVPMTPSGREVLRESVGQSPNGPLDYAGLMRH